MQEEMSGQELRQQLEALMGTTTEPASFDLWLGTVNFCHSQTKKYDWRRGGYYIQYCTLYLYNDSISIILAATSICVPQRSRLYINTTYITHIRIVYTYTHTISYHISNNIFIYIYTYIHSLYKSFNILELLPGNMFYWSNPRSDIAEDTGTAALVSRLQAAEEARLQETIWWAASDLRSWVRRYFSC